MSHIITINADDENESVNAFFKAIEDQPIRKSTLTIETINGIIETHHFTFYNNKTKNKSNMATENEVIPPVEETKIEKTQEQLIDETVNTAVGRFDINMQRLTELKDQFSTLTIVDAKDKEGHKKVKEAKATIRTARTTLEKARKGEKDFYVQVGKKIDAKAGEYGTVIAEIETPLDEKLRLWDEWQAEEEKRKEEEANALLKNRVEQLIGAGMEFNGSYYAIGPTMSMDVVTIKGWKDGEFTFFLEKVKLEKQRLDKEAADKAEADRIQKEKDDAAAAQIQAQKEENDRRQKQLDDDATKQQQERDDMRRERLVMRQNMATGIGMVADAATLSYIFKNKYVDFAISKDAMENLSSDEYTALIGDYGPKITIAKDNQEKHDKAEALRLKTIENRKGQLSFMGLILSGDIYSRALLDNQQIDVSMIAVNDDDDRQWTERIERIGGLIKTDNEETERRATAQREAADKAEQAFEQRQEILLNLGFKKGTGKGFFAYSNQHNDIYSLAIDDVKNATDDSWPSILTIAEGKVADIDFCTSQKNEAIEIERKKNMGQKEQFLEYLGTIEHVAPIDLPEGAVGNVAMKFMQQLSALIDAAKNQVSEIN